jgi:hypothetical protein
MASRALVFLLVLAVITRAATDNFDAAKPGPLPSDWTAKWTGTQTGNGMAKWSIEKDDAAPSKPHVLAQRGEAQYPVALKNDTAIKDGFVEVKFKPVEWCGARRTRTTTTSPVPTRSKIIRPFTTRSRGGACRSRA